MSSQVLLLLDICKFHKVIKEKKIKNVTIFLLKEYHRRATRFKQASQNLLLSIIRIIKRKSDSLVEDQLQCKVHNLSNLAYSRVFLRPFNQVSSLECSQAFLLRSLSSSFQVFLPAKKALILLNKTLTEPDSLTISKTIPAEAIARTHPRIILFYKSLRPIRRVQIQI